MLNYIIWNVSPEIFSGFPVRWYGLFFGIGFFLSYMCAVKAFTREGFEQDKVDTSAFCIFIFLLIGLRLGHCCFYEPNVYLTPYLHPLITRPDGTTHIDWYGLSRIFRVWEGGLASHGGGIGLICAFLYLAHKFNRNFWWLASRVVLVLPITAFFVRMGNLMNSEIYGVATTLPWSFVFVRDAVVAANPDALSDALLQAGIVSQDAYASLHGFLVSCLSHWDQVSFMNLFEILEKYRFINEGQFNATVDAFVSSGLLTSNHPTQIYEALTYLLTGVILIAYYQLTIHKGEKVSSFMILGLAMLFIFVTRFLYEFIKNDQVDFEQGMFFNMGQLLSVPYIIAGIVFVCVSVIQKKRGTTV